MQESIIIKEEEIEIFDLTCDGDDDEFNPDKAVMSNVDTSLKTNCEGDKLCKNSELKPCGLSLQEETTVDTHFNISKHVRNADKSLDKALKAIKKGGSLVTVAFQYGIPTDVLHQKLISRTLPQEKDLLSETEEKNLLKWILQSNSKNSLVFRHDLLGKVAKMKKVMKITPIFHKSKFGRMWYDYFLKSHPEIYENDGLLLPSDNGINVKKFNQPSESKGNFTGSKLNNDRTTNNEVQVIKSNQPSESKGHFTRSKLNNDKSTNDEVQNIQDLFSYFGIKNAVVVLEDFRKQENSSSKLLGEVNIPIEMKEDELKPIDGKSSEVEVDKVDFDWLKSDEESAAESDDSWKVGKASTILSKSKSKKLKKPRKLANNTSLTCETCNQVFINQAKLKRHSFLHIAKEMYNIQCYQCFKKFPSTERFKEHMTTSHGSKHHLCSECGQVFKYRTSLSRHKRLKHSKCASSFKEFICDICERSFVYKNSLEQHIIYGHMKHQGKHSCDICKKNFFKYSQLARHKMKHSKIKLFSCSRCPRTFARKYLHTEHIKSCFKKKKKISETLKCDDIS